MNTEKNPNLNDETNIEESSQDSVNHVETPEQQENLSDQSTKEQLEKTIDELNNKVLRLLAENQNLRKKNKREKEDILKYGFFNFVSQILSLTDNLDRAFSIFKNNDKFKDKEFIDIKNGIELIEKELQVTLEKNNITYIDCLNKKFDPNFHQALSEIESDKDHGTVIEEIQKGYMLHDRLLRPSLVNIAKSAK